MNNIRPQLMLLNEEQIRQIHHYALRILSETGVRVDAPSVVEMLGNTGQAEVQGRSVKFSPALVEAAIQSAPSSIQIFDRRGNLAFTLGDDERLRLGIGVTALYYQEPVNETLELFTRQHMRDLTRLGNALPLYDVISTPGIVRDVPEHLGDLYGSLEHFANTTKPLVLLVSDERNFAPVLDMFEHLHGGLGEKPFVLPYFNPVSPLVMDSGTLLKMGAAIERGLPFIFSNYSMAGASTPLTPAGMLALLLAELLAGLTISQVMKSGAPVLLGMLPVYFDMKSMLNFYDPQSILLNLACAEMMAHYNLPHCGTSGSGTGWGMDLIAADTYWMNTLTFALKRGGLAPFIGDSLGSKTISPTTILHVHEIIDQALRFADGFQLDDEQAALEEIAKVGPGGSFLLSPSTLKNYKTGYYVSAVYPRWTMERWQAEGRPDARQVLREKTQAVLADLSAPEDYEELLGRGEEYIRHLRK
ncbi:MAG: trimethylamine methyltransferase family protein [Anaerolineales bacterium]|nr:trimethylamine methyltransferase family protein [Anaerolineales bacterium]